MFHVKRGHSVFYSVKVAYFGKYCKVYNGVQEYKQYGNKVHNGMCVRVVVIFAVGLWSNACINC